ncbi:hypothetical protein, partial [Raoultella terrigena]|uniref:hypothetical protein n=1 Tax=Raoultella terrigena TaxID=577 RepID=UPI0013302F62
IFSSPAAAAWLTLLEAMELSHRPERVRAAALTPFVGKDVATLDTGGDDLTDEVAHRMRTWAGLLARRGVAAVLAAFVVHVPGPPAQLRPLAAGAAVLPLAILANGPSTAGDPTADLLGWTATLLVLGVASAFAPRVWALGAAAWATVGVLGMGLFLAVNPWSSVAYLDFDGTMPVDSI